MREDCIIWKGNKNIRGYGLDKGRLVHRKIYEEKYGAIPSRMYVCHKCDQRDCYNIDHLFLGTPKDNTQDMISKKRMSCGEKSPKSKLSDNDVREIFHKRHQGMFFRDIAKFYGIKKHTVYEILTNRKWKHAKEWFDKEFLEKINNMPDDPSGKIGSECHNSKLKEDDISEIRRLRKEGMFMKDIAKIYGVSDVTIEDIISKRTWKHILD